jgi:ATP-dependent Clp protease ATP-binding subunit ClpC
MELDSLTKLFSTHLKQALLKAMNFADEFGHEQVTLPHLLYGLSAQKGSLSSELLTKAEFPVDLLKQELIRAYHQPYLTNEGKSVLHDDVIDVITKAVRTGQLYEHTYIGTEHVLACLLHLADQHLRDLLRLWQINSSELQRQLLVVLKSTSKFPDLAGTLQDLQQQQEDQDFDTPEFPVLESLATELTTQESLTKISPLIGRQPELIRLQQILSRRYKNTPLLVGHPGVGKTAIVEGLARLIASGKAPHSLQNKRIFHLELSSLVAGTMYRGEFEQRLKSLITECKNNKEIILFIDEFHTLVGAGSSGQPLDAANILKPALARGEIKCIGATTFKEYQKHLQPDGALARRLELIKVDQPSKEETKTVLEGITPHLEKYHHVRFSKEALEEALDLSERYMSHRKWPDKAIDLLDESAAAKTILRKIPKEKKQEIKLKAKLKSIQSKKQEALNQDCYKEALTHHKSITGVITELDNLTTAPIKKERITGQQVREALSRKLAIDLTHEQNYTNFAEQIEDQLNQEVIGQTQITKPLSQHLQRSFSPLKEHHKPLGAFLLVGPSGVGKTQTAKSLAKSLFGSVDSLIRLDMSEYSEKQTISKLLGAPAGYIGHQQSGLLHAALEEHPQSVLLFDEVEKAHPELFNILLQILDEGKLRDSNGNELDFSQTLILMTSNLGNDEAKEQLGFGQLAPEQRAIETKQIVTAKLKQFFRPELINRLDEVLHFTPLDISDRQAIIKRKLNQLNTRLANWAELTISDDLVLAIATNEYKPEQGVRSLEQFIKSNIEFPLSQKLPQIKKNKTKAKLEKTQTGYQLETQA